MRPYRTKVGRQHGWAVRVTDGKESVPYEAILLGCGENENPQNFLSIRPKVRIRWKINDYEQTVATDRVELLYTDAPEASSSLTTTMPKQLFPQPMITTPHCPPTKEYSLPTILDNGGGDSGNVDVMERENSIIENLSNDVAFILATFLAPSDLVRLGRSCKRFGVAASSDGKPAAIAPKKED